MTVNNFFIYLRALIPTLYFNFRQLPLNKAIKLPFYVYKIRMIEKGGGRIIIDTPMIRRGMIKLGFPRAATYPNSGITWRNRGTIIFKGKCVIGNDCSIVVGKSGNLTFGDNFHVNAGLKLVSEYSITFGENVLLGWNVKILDTNFHYIYDKEKQRNKRGYGRIVIGDNNWISTDCLVLNGVVTPEGCIFGARSVLTHGVNLEQYCLYGGSPLKILARNVMRRPGQDGIIDYFADNYDC